MSNPKVRTLKVTTMEHQQPQSEDIIELSGEFLSQVAGGINPQPLPPCHKED
jgi:hypothetical protein